MKQRIIGFDVARAFAIFGMIIVNFKVAMNADTGNGFLLWFSHLFEGRASALFVILAGIGISFFSQKNSDARVKIKKARLSLVKRGSLLIIIGLLYTSVWPADILHFYGFYFFIAALLIGAPDKILLVASAIITMLFPLLLLVFNYDKGWNWDTLTYVDFWTIDGMIRHIFFNGFHPVIPWSAFLLYGMWLGRQNVNSNQFRRRLFITALVTYLTMEIGSQIILGFSHQLNGLSINQEALTYLFSTAIIPPMPQYLLASGSLATLIILLCLKISEKLTDNNIIHALYQTGKLSLTLYVAHVIIGMGTLEALGLLQDQTIERSLLSAAIFCLLGLLFSMIWLRYFKAGPLEWLFRKLAS